MKKIASPDELASELRSLLAYAEGEQPSREKIASGLRGLAQRVASPPVADLRGLASSKLAAIDPNRMNPKVRKHLRLLAYEYLADMYQTEYASQFEAPMAAAIAIAIRDSRNVSKITADVEAAGFEDTGLSPHG